jgi:hypothetical protein
MYYDRVRRRLWIFGQRCHHGASGAFLTFLGAVGIALMVHDWKDARCGSRAGGRRRRIKRFAVRSQNPAAGRSASAAVRDAGA